MEIQPSCSVKVRSATCCGEVEGNTYHAAQGIGARGNHFVGEWVLLRYLVSTRVSETEWATDNGACRTSRSRRKIVPKKIKSIRNLKSNARQTPERSNAEYRQHYALQPARSLTSSSLPLTNASPPSLTMNQNDFRRFAQQIQKAAGGGGGAGGFPRGGPPRGTIAGGGLIIALIAGGLVLNASLFNGA